MGAALEVRQGACPQCKAGVPGLYAGGMRNWNGWAWILTIVIGVVLVIVLWSDLLNPLYRGASIQGIASVLTVVATLILLNLTHKADQRAQAAQRETAELLENSRNQAAALELQADASQALAEATRQQSDVMLAALKPNLVLRIACQKGSPGHAITPATDDAMYGLELVNLSDGFVYIVGADYAPGTGPTHAILINDDSRVLAPGDKMQLPFHRRGDTEPVTVRFPLGKAWTVTFSVTYNFHRTGSQEHRLVGKLYSLQGTTQTVHLRDPQDNDKYVRSFRATATQNKMLVESFVDPNAS